ncbi:MAG TPA: VOC family protein [Ilumatobacter sp.]|nr:VOC family protein [Ilumatobacter sp.]
MMNSGERLAPRAIISHVTKGHIMDPATAIKHHHHLTMCVGTAQEDYDFHTQLLGLKSVKKTALYDGTVPIYHLYYANDLGDESTILTSFPMRQSGRVGRKGSGQVRSIALSVPESSLGFWADRFKDQGYSYTTSERFGEKMLVIQNPGHIEYEITGIADDDRKPWTGSGVPSDMGIRGTHGITVSVRDLEASMEFMEAGWNGHRTQEEGDYVRYEVGDGGSGAVVDFKLDPSLPAGSWTFGEGVVHHVAFAVDNLDVQTGVKAHLEGLGYTDVSDRKDRGYFESVYVRTPGGALFEATVSKPEGFLIDESYEDLGCAFQIPPVFADQAEWIKDYLEPLHY